jgi:hypothetical protein
VGLNLWIINPFVFSMSVKRHCPEKDGDEASESFTVLYYWSNEYDMQYVYKIPDSQITQEDRNTLEKSCFRLMSEDNIPEVLRLSYLLDKEWDDENKYPDSGKWGKYREGILQQKGPITGQITAVCFFGCFA